MRFPIFAAGHGSRSLLPVMVVLNHEEYERQMALIDLYGKLAVAEQQIAEGAEGEDFALVARQLRERVHGNV